VARFARRGATNEAFLALAQLREALVVGGLGLLAGVHVTTFPLKRRQEPHTPPIS
jgi:hypothetical protein